MCVKEEYVCISLTVGSTPTAAPGPIPVESGSGCSNMECLGPLGGIGGGGVMVHHYRYPPA